jgi:SulP family sulfate permease
VLHRIADTHRVLVIDFAAVPFLDSTAANTIESLARRAVRRGVTVVLTGAGAEVRTVLMAHGAGPPLVRYEATVELALARLRPRAPEPEAGVRAV